MADKTFKDAISSRSVKTGIETALKPAVSGIMRMGQSVAGLVDMASDYSQAEAAKAQPVKDEKTGWADIPKKVWQTLTESSDEQQKRALTNSRQYHAQLAPVTAAVKKEAHQDYEFAKNSADQIDQQMGVVGKAVAKGVEMTPSLMLSGGSSGARALGNTVLQTAMDVGKEQDVKAAGPALASQMIVPGNSKAATVASQVVEDGISAGSSAFADLMKKRKKSNDVAQKTTTK